LTRSTFTGQYSHLIPAGAQGLDRYAYVNNSPVNFTDPSGHFIDPVSLTVYGMIGEAIVGGAVNALEVA